MTLSQRIRDYRYSKGWGPDELAGRANISRTALYQIECGRTEAPRAGTLCRIAKALGVGVESLLGAQQESLSRAMAEHDEAHNGDSELTDESWSEIPAGLRGDGLAAHAGRFANLPRVAVAGSVETRKAFDDLMDSPYADTVSRILGEMHRLLPVSRERAAV